MAITHVKSYFKEVEAQYFEMLADLKDFEDGYKEGYITKEQIDQAEKYIEVLKNNYERLAYVMFLFNKPRKASARKSFNKTNKVLSNYLEPSSESAIKAENENVLVNLRKYIKELKDDCTGTTK